jgi:CRP-like cAMP-binding protein
MKHIYVGGNVDAIYFPIDCVISLLVQTGDGQRVEVATIGNEGATGVYSMLRGGRSVGENIVQSPGDALRLDIRKFNRYLASSTAFSVVMHRYLFALTRQVMQAGACNRVHTMEQRCSRWLLMMHDRADSHQFRLTQEFLSDMLGVRRATVNLAVGRLKKMGLIQYARGQITVVNRAGLEGAACPCYELIRREYRALARADESAQESLSAVSEREKPGSVL